MFERPRSGERAVLVRLGLGAPLDPEDLNEFTQLATSAGAIPVATHHRPARAAGSAVLRRQRQGRRRSASRPKPQQADVILVDHPLSPSQERNLEKLIGRRVLDRSGLILDIFAQRANSHEGKLEVELAQLKHIASRLVRGWTHLERQRGGGIGLRGPGETQLETDRRLLGKRVQRADASAWRSSSSSARPVAARALPSRFRRWRWSGYTNAGKSTLFRSLTGEDAYIADQLFATLDPTVRRLQLPGGTPVVVADTVGFIRDLPHELVAAFQSTLTEAREATLLLHVIDASDPRRGEHIEEVDRVLDADWCRRDSQHPRVQQDRPAGNRAADRSRRGRRGGVRCGSAPPQGVGLELLVRAVAERLSRGVQRMRLHAAADRRRGARPAVCGGRGARRAPSDEALRSGRGSAGCGTRGPGAPAGRRNLFRLTAIP